MQDSKSCGVLEQNGRLCLQPFLTKTWEKCMHEVVVETSNNVAIWVVLSSVTNGIIHSIVDILRSLIQPMAQEIDISEW